jgi:tRNA wybutosine-synthesizing protein 1
MTLVKNHNMNNIDEYANLVKKANPTFIEAKAYMHIGFSNLRLKFDDMPQLAEVKAFAEELAEKTGYNIINESADSRVVLLAT